MIDVSKINFNYSKDGELDEIRKYLEEQSFKNLDKNKKTIFFSVSSWTGTSLFRIMIPLLAMIKKYPDKYNYCYSEHEGFPIEWLQQTDIWIQHRAGNTNSIYLKFVKIFPMGVKRPVVINDNDDNEYNLPPTHPMKELWYSTGKHNMALYQISNADYLSTTGKALQREFSKNNKHDNIKIFTNTFDWSLPQWNEPRTEFKIPIIGWAGLTSHFEDLKKIAVILKAIHDKYPQVQFKIAGISPHDEFVNIKTDDKGKKVFEKQNITDEKITYKYRVTELFKSFDPSRIELMGILPHETYGTFYNKWNINLAYIEHNEFNRCKSAIKVYEGAIYKSINVYSNFGGYQNEFTNITPIELKKELLKHCAMQTENVSEWVNALSFWIENYNTELWNKVVEDQYNFVKEKFDVYNQLDERISFYDYAVDKHERYYK